MFDAELCSSSRTLNNMKTSAGGFPLQKNDAEALHPGYQCDAGERQPAMSLRRMPHSLHEKTFQSHAKGREVGLGNISYPVSEVVRHSLISSSRSMFNCSISKKKQNVVWPLKNFRVTRDVEAVSCSSSTSRFNFPVTPFLFGELDIRFRGVRGPPCITLLLKREKSRYGIVLSKCSGTIGLLVLAD